MTTATALNFKIDGMHCAACVRRVTHALSREPGVEVQDVQVGEASVIFDGTQASAESIASAVNRIGFRAVAGPANG